LWLFAFLALARLLQRKSITPTIRDAPAKPLIPTKNPNAAGEIALLFAAAAAAAVVVVVDDDDDDDDDDETELVPVVVMVENVAMMGMARLPDAITVTVGATAVIVTVGDATLNVLWFVNRTGAYS
jgi:hypothetical protein